MPLPLLLLLPPAVAAAPKSQIKDSLDQASSPSCLAVQTLALGKDAQGLLLTQQTMKQLMLLLLLSATCLLQQLQPKQDQVTLPSASASAWHPGSALLALMIFNIL